MTTYLREWYWNDPERKRPQVLLGLTTDDAELFGYGTWKHREMRIEGDDESHAIFIHWFGTQERFRGAKLDSGELGAGVLYATLEADARGHADSAADTPILLDCHVDNGRALAFWESRGFVRFELIESPSGRYHRMRR